MINCPNFDKIAARFDEYWHRENHDRPLMVVRAPAEKCRPMPEFNGTKRERWLDTEYMLKRTRIGLENTLQFGEAFPTAFPNLGPDIFGAFLGCDIEFEETTSYATGFVDDLNELDLSSFNYNSFWWKKIVEMTEAMLDESKGDYLVGVTDIHPGMDALVSLRGPENLCFDLYEEPELVEKLAIQLFGRFKDAYTGLHSIISRKQKGETNWLNIYHPEGWYVTSCDFMGMISEPMMKRFVLPELKMELDLLGHSVFHLDGVGALRHLDCLLELPNLHGIQWVYGAGEPTAAHWIDVIKRIQAAGKMVHIDITAEDLPVLLENVEPEGILYNTHCESADDAKALIRMAENARPKKIF